MDDDDEYTPMNWRESAIFWVVVGSPFAAVLLGMLLAGWMK